MKSSLAIFLCFLTTMALFVYSKGLCSFEFRKQPPSTARDCNPYLQNTIRISLECIVRRAVGTNNTYSIKWFRENTTGSLKSLGIGDPVVQQNNDRTSQYHGTAFFNQAYSPSLLGKYWCQVINTTADPDQPLMRSNVFTLLAPGNYSGPTCISVQTTINKTCADLPDSQPVQTTPLVPTTAQQLSSDLQPVHTTTLLLPSTSEISVVPTTMSTTVRSSDNTFIFTSYNTGGHVTTSSRPSPTGSAGSTTLTIAGVSAGVVLVLLLVIACSIFIVILMVMKRRKACNKQQLHSGGYNNNAVIYNNCTKDNINMQPNSTATITSPQPVIYDQPDELKRTMSAASKGGNVINSEYSCLTDATTSGPPPAAAPVLFDDPMYDAAGVNDNQYSHLENAVTGGDTCYSKLGYNQAAATNTLPMVTGDDQYSSLNTSSNTVGRGDSSKLAAGYGEQEYSSLQHRGVPAAPSDMVGHTTADQQQYSVLNK